MPDHHSTSLRRILAPLIFLITSVALPPLTSVRGEEAKTVPFSLPISLPGTDWRASGQPDTLEADQFSVVPGAEVFLEYGLQKVTTYRYRKGPATLTVELFEMLFPSGAFGLFTFNRGSLPQYRQEFNAGKYLVSVAMTDHKHVMSPEIVSAVREPFASIKSGDEPLLMSHLPTEGKISGSEKYLVGPAALGQTRGFSDLRDLIDFTGGVEVATADYQIGESPSQLIIIEYHTPQSAADGYAATQNYVNGLSESEKQSRILKRIGNYVVAAAGVKDRTAVQAIVDKVKYTVRVSWEGRSLSAVPLQFRPTDPAALEEAAETAKVLLRTFYGIGFLMTGTIILGVFTGWAVFYWRKQRRRRLGMDNFFSDAGDTVRLNLDDYIFQPNEQPIKLLGKGDL